jgi:hypothetical protein
MMLNPMDDPTNYDEDGLFNADPKDRDRSPAYLDSKQAEEDAEIVRRILSEKRSAEAAYAGTEEEVRRYLLAQGCGAFVGRSACAQPVMGFREGDAQLRFQSAVGAWASESGEPDPSTRYLVACCWRHGGLETGPLLQDIDPLTHAQQMAAAARWFSDHGHVLRLGDAPQRRSGSGLVLP